MYYDDTTLMSLNRRNVEKRRPTPQDKSQLFHSSVLIMIKRFSEDFPTGRTYTLKLGNLLILK